MFTDVEETLGNSSGRKKFFLQKKINKKNIIESPMLTSVERQRGKAANLWRSPVKRGTAAWKIIDLFRCWRPPRVGHCTVATVQSAAQTDSIKNIV